MAVVSRGLFHLLAVLACVAACPASVAFAQESSDERLVSELRGLRPETPGIDLQVVERDRFLRLENKTGATVVVAGYAEEPFLRFQPSGQVEVNARSPSKFVSEDRFGKRPVPASANASAAPRWQAVSSDGSYQWFDHRIHYMAPGVPPEVKDPAKPTKVFDWTVPMEVSGKKVRALGTVNWDPTKEEEDSGSSVLPIVLGGIGLVAVVAAVALMLRRRRRAPAPAVEGKSGKEAW